MIDSRNETIVFVPLKDISQIYTSLMTAAGASQSVFDYLDRKPVQRPSGTLTPKEFRGNIEFNSVSLVYPARPTEVAVQVPSLHRDRSSPAIDFVCLGYYLED